MHYQEQEQWEIPLTVYMCIYVHVCTSGFSLRVYKCSNCQTERGRGLYRDILMFLIQNLMQGKLYSTLVTTQIRESRVLPHETF